MRAPSHAPADFAMSPQERIAEIGEILAAGLIRLRARQSSQLRGGGGESSLASLGRQSGSGSPKEVRTGK